MSKPDLSVVIMAFNEQENLPAIVQSTHTFLAQVCQRHEILVVNDGSSDQTGPVAEGLAARIPNVVALHHDRNRGMGMAIRTGYRNASLAYVSQLPADGQVDPRTLGLFLPYLQDYDLVLSTYRDRGDTLQRRVASQVFQLVGYIICGERTKNTGTMVFKRDLLEGVALRSSTFFVNFELPLQLLQQGVAARWIEIEAQPRQAGQSKVFNLRTIVNVVGEMVRFRLGV